MCFARTIFLFQMVTRRMPGRTVQWAMARSGTSAPTPATSRASQSSQARKMDASRCEWELVAGPYSWRDYSE